MFSTDFIQTQKQSLLDMQRHLSADLSDVAENDPQHPGTLIPRPESPSNSSEDDMTDKASTYADELSLTEELEKQLQDVNKALESIEKGTYGICKYCKKEIDIKRLEARPHSSSCIACKKLLTQEL